LITYKTQALNLVEPHCKIDPPQMSHSDLYEIATYTHIHAQI